MTTVRKPLTRETGALWRGRPIVLELGNTLIRVRLKGDRTWYTVPVDWVYSLGAKIYAAEKEKARKEAGKQAEGRER